MSLRRRAFGVTCRHLLLQGVGKGAAVLTFTFSRRSFPWATMEFITLFGAVGFFSQAAIPAALLGLGFWCRTEFRWRGLAPKSVLEPKIFLLN